MGDILTRIIELPATVSAMTVVDENGDYNIYINAALTREAADRALRHEMAHVRGGHFEADKPVAECEREADATGGRGRRK